MFGEEVVVNFVMVLIHILCAAYLSIWALIITIPLHFIVLNTKKGNKVDKVDRNDFTGPRRMENLAYQDYLVRAYKIEKNEVLGTYSVENQVFNSLQEALDAAYIKDTKE
jgi:hypothetical protein